MKITSIEPKVLPFFIQFQIVVTKFVEIRTKVTQALIFQRESHALFFVIKNGKTLGSIEVIFMPYVVHTVVVYFIVDSSN
jgi:hypothetical protein